MISTTQERKITHKQRKKMFSFFKKATREERLRVISSIVGREVKSSNELTVKEAAEVIDYMEQLRTF